MIKVQYSLLLYKLERLKVADSRGPEGILLQKNLTYGCWIKDLR